MIDNPQDHVPSLYSICQALYEREWDLYESTAGHVCICGWEHHWLVLRGTPILCKKGDMTQVIYAGAVHKGKDGFDNMFLLGKIVEALGVEVTD